MTTNKTPYLMALLVMTLFTTGASCDLIIKHGGIFEIVDNVMLGRNPLYQVDTGQNGDLFGGDLSCATGCFVNEQSCNSCANCDCSSCANCDCTNCSDCAACGNCAACVITPINFATAHPGARISNATQVRLTTNGLTYLEQNLGTMFADLLPPLDADTLIPFCPYGTPATPAPTTCTLLPDGVTELKIGTNGTVPDFLLTVESAALDGVEADGSLAATVDIGGSSTVDGTNQAPTPLKITVDTVQSGYTIKGTITCNLDFDSTLGDAPNGFQVQTKLRLANDGTAGSPHNGYSKVEVTSIDFVENSLDPEDVTTACSGTLSISGTGCNTTIDLNQILNNDGQVVCGIANIYLDNADHNFDGIEGNNSSAHTGGVAELVKEIVDHVRLKMDEAIDYQIGAFLHDTSPSATDKIGPWVVCQKPAATAPQCPAGTVFVDKPAGVADYCAIGNASGPCLGPLLGMQGQIDVGGALASVSPGIDAVIDFLFAAAGNSRAPGAGFNIDFMGGLENLQHNDCVPVTAPENMPVLPTVPIATQINGDTNLKGAPTHLAVGVSESFVNYAAWKVWDAGALCLNVGTSLDQMLSGSTLNALFLGGGDSLAKLTFPAAPSSAAFGITIRPGTAPVISFGDNDAATPARLINVVMDAVELDFYAWTQDRYVRFFTLKTDLVIGVDLPVVNNAIVIDAANDMDLAMNNPELLNSELTLGDPVALANTISGLGGTIVAGLGAAIPPISINEMLGGVALPAGMSIPVGVALTNDSFGAFTEGTENFLGVFIDFGPAPVPIALTAKADAQVRITNVTMPEDLSGFAFDTFQQGPSPSVEIAMSANGPEGAEFEYSYRLTNSSWSPWTSSSYAVIEDPSLFMQQWHTVYVRARVKGAENSTDFTSATARFLIDADEPQLLLSNADGVVELSVYDVVNEPEELEYRYRNPGDDWSEWATAPSQTFELDGATMDVEVEVRDTSGNIASNSQALRGIADPTATSGCGTCVATGARGTDGSPLGYLASALLLGALVVRRRRR